MGHSFTLALLVTIIFEMEKGKKTKTTIIIWSQPIIMEKVEAKWTLCCDNRDNIVFAKIH